MEQHIFEKEYVAILNGILKNTQGTISAPIARKENSIMERCVSVLGESAVTHYKLYKTKDNLSFVNFKLETGRTHQIRVHSLYIGHPILGDTLYSESSNLISRQALHAYRVRFIHPITKTPVQYIAPIPEDMKKIIGTESFIF